MQYHRAGENGAVNSSGAGFASQDSEIIEIEGKKFKRVQIEDKDEEYLMDEDANIYDMSLRKIGKAGDSDEENDHF